MDMDMDIPLPEELEWLEANSHLQDDYEEQPDFYPEEEEPPPPPQEKYQPNPQPSKPILSIPAKPTVPPHPKSQSSTDPPSVFTTQSNGQKRPRSDDSSAPESISTSSSGDKRSRIHIVEDPEIDEDWLRYSPPKDTNTDVVDQVIVIEEKFVSRYASEIDGDCFPVTGPGGDRVYAKIGRVERRDSSKKLVVQAQSEGLTLEPINVLLQRVEQEAFTKVLEASSEVQSDVTISKAPVLTEQLWVEKYAPNSFTELLSDEHTNREVLLWLKQWDSRVFGSEIRSTTDEVLSSLRQHSNIAQHKKISDRNYSRKYGGARFTKEAIPFSNNYNQENDNSKGIQELWSKKPRLTGPPEQKVLLLCGPPGLGKTTLAHVAAKHCGYHVVEINASDDRSASSIEPKILDVLQMNSVMADSKPKCLVIDEIDGALGDGKGAVEVILKMVLAEKKSDTGSQYVARDGQSGRISSKKGRKTASLSRPVICICNDLYAPALRPLRHVAKVHKFVQPTVSRVVSRLKYICNKEGLRTSSIALTALAQFTECDIRSCLNTLQFLNKKKEALNVMELSSQVVGRKDISKSVFDIWKEIFQKRKLKQERKSNNSSSSVSNEFDFLHSLVSSRGDYDLILDGIHENVLQLHYHDPVMQKTVKCLNSLGVSDLIHQYIMRTQQMPLLVYQPPIAITVHRLIAQAEKPNIEWPKSFQRCRTMLIEKMEILQSWHNKISPYISRHLSTKSFVEESVSPLLHILSPPTLRPVALHLLSEKEKNELEQLISTMVSYSITYKNVKFDPLSSNLRHGAVSDTPLLSFDPPIGDFINFKDYRSGHYVLALAMKQLLLHEVEKKKILQVSINRSMHLTNGCNKEDQALVTEENSRVPSAKTNYAVGCVEKNTEYAKNKLNSRQSNSDISTSPGSRRSATTIVKLKSPGVIKKSSSGPSNFFDRFRKSSSKGSQITDNAKQKTATAERDSRPLIFKFNEGFTNAIKRPVRIRDFLQ